MKTFKCIGELGTHLQTTCRSYRVAQAHGVFDLLHVSHVRHLQAARHLADFLVVTVTPDRFVNKGADRPIVTEVERMEMLAALWCVDYVALNEWPTAAEAIRLIRPTVYAKGDEYRHAKTPLLMAEIDVLKEINAELVFTPPAFGPTTTELVRRIRGVEPRDGPHGDEG